MLGAHRYQIILIDSIGDRGDTLEKTLRRQVKALGLDPDEALLFLPPDRLSQLDDRSPAAAVYFGGARYRRKFDTAVKRLVDRGIPTVPAVPTLKKYTIQVPAPLHKINGFELDPADRELNGIAALVLEMLRLMRERRRLFISYKRTESQVAAVQLYHELDKRGFQVFLDTHSIRQGAVFQEQLFQKMADADMVVFLNTDTVLESEWVQKEVEQSDAMGITLLQLIWPDVTRDRRTDMFVPEYLRRIDFQNSGRKRDGGYPLRPKALARIVSIVERVRARSLAAREQRLLDSLRKYALRQGLNTVVQRTRYVDVERPKRSKPVRIVLGLGVPDAVVFQDSEEMRDKPTPKAIRLLYDSRNITGRWQTHLKWLNGMVSVKMVSVQELPKWLGKVKSGTA